MSAIEFFLTASEEAEIVDAIKQAEAKTSGEIRVHIEAHCHSKTVEERAVEVFYLLRMQHTQALNGVLFYVAVNDRKFAIYGDKGIHEKVDQTFWDDVKLKMTHHFKQKQFKEGIVQGILMAGDKLKYFFPWDVNDTNELPNTISKG